MRTISADLFDRQELAYDGKGSLLTDSPMTTTVPFFEEDVRCQRKRAVRAGGLKAGPGT